MCAPMSRKTPPSEREGDSESQTSLCHPPPLNIETATRSRGSNRKLTPGSTWIRAGRMRPIRDMTGASAPGYPSRPASRPGWCRWAAGRPGRRRRRWGWRGRASGRAARSRAGASRWAGRSPWTPRRCPASRRPGRLRRRWPSARPASGRPRWRAPGRTPSGRRAPDPRSRATSAAPCATPFRHRAGPPGPASWAVGRGA